MKNWNGNKNSIYKTLGASNHTKDDRENNDYYATDPNSVKELLKVETFNHNIIECAIGEGHIAEVLRCNNHYVKGYDIIDRGYRNTTVKDFLSLHKDNIDLINFDIISNPPYKYALDFVKKSLELVDNGNKVVMLLKIQFLEGQKRYKFYKENNPKIVYVFSKRQACAKNGKFIVDNKRVSSAVAYAWFVWVKGFQGETIIKWI